jgi:hypothetical protein
MKRLLAVLTALLVCVPALAQERYTQADLDRLLAPVALYPDTLLSQVLMASTYPLEVVEAARWSRARPGLRGDEAVRAAQDEDWDPSVQSLLAFPNLLQRMDEKLDWTQQLGEAFLAQEADVMDTVQQLRRKARAAGHLLADDRLRVVDDGTVLAVEYADPGYVYVPYYDPWVVYGTWWWPAHPPVVWSPWLDYVVVRPGIWWGTRVFVSAGFFFGGVDWHRRHVKVVHVHNHYVRRPIVRKHAVVHRPIEIGRWRHDPAHRRGVVYRHPEVKQRFGVAPAPRREAQREVRRVSPRVQPQPPRQAQPQFRSQPQRQREEPRAGRRDDRRGHAMPPAFRASAPERAQPPAARSQPAPRRERALPYDRGHGRTARPVDRADRVGRVRADAAQHRAAQPHRFAGDARRDARAVPVRPAVRAGMAGDRPRMAR